MVVASDNDNEIDCQEVIVKAQKLPKYGSKNKNQLTGIKCYIAMMTVRHGGNYRLMAEQEGAIIGRHQKSTTAIVEYFFN